ncbi:MAG: enoyl-CoA hydratase/isomerase family protein [Desulfobulbaceae bacterium]|uniref:Enoyl-CoA hydratase/isomerase family protein n=1 Tax=Candidatus Desulfobia pelagia TaxID=2841692 RepID=A0A8J6NE56_9BACT|nr:enoyl-CoA hydratase/isomerase family protein [Candidatus Desulfobia pelagia]
MTHLPHPVLISERKENVIYLTLNRPDVLNALNKSLLFEIKKELETIQNNPEIQAVIITGAGNKAFSAGADIQYLNQASPLQVRELANLAVYVNHLIENLNKISIALINGFALGGGLELAESCMFRIAASTAKIGHPEVRIGAVSGWGGTTRLPRLIGKSRAAEMLLTGKMIDANEGLQIGLVNRVTDSENLSSEGEKLLQQILQNSPIAVNLTWDAVHRGLDLPIDESARLGADYFGLVATTEDFRTGTKAFLKKRKAKFQNR